MYSCNWMFNVAEAGTYVIDTQTTTTFTIVSALVKYYDTMQPDDSTCTVRLSTATSVSAIVNETLQNKDVVVVCNVPFTVTGGGKMYLHTTAAVSLMLSVIGIETGPAPGPIPVSFEISKCDIFNPPWWAKYVNAEDNYPQFTVRNYYFTSTRTTIEAGITNSTGGYPEWGSDMWNSPEVNALVYQGNDLDLWSYDPYPTYFHWAESQGRVYMHLNTLRRIDVTSGGLTDCICKWELSVEVRFCTGVSDPIVDTWNNATVVLAETMLSEPVSREVSPTELVFKDREGYEYRIH